MAPTQPEKKLKRENSIVPPATPIVHVHQIEVAPRADTVVNHPSLQRTPSPKITPPSAPVVTSSISVMTSLPSISTSKSVIKTTSSHRPFKKEATDKWVSALALLELAQGVS